jgi:hypothetical protein
MAQAQFLIRRKWLARLCVLVVLALSFAQVGAIQHQYAHGTSGQVCSDCLSFAPLLATAGGKAQLPSVARVHVATIYPFLVAPVVGHPPQHAFRSRAPPSLS